MGSSGKPFDVGYSKPPTHTQFVKGWSGNPKGRPKGSQNISTLLRKVTRERVKVTVNGVTRHITKMEAGLMQLSNKAASGDPRAIREILYWSNLFAESQPEGLSSPVADEADKAVMESILHRIRQSETLSNVMNTDSTETNTSQGE